MAQRMVYRGPMVRIPEIGSRAVRKLENRLQLNSPINDSQERTKMDAASTAPSRAVSRNPDVLKLNAVFETR